MSRIIMASHDPALVGAKAANLARLAAVEGIAVPPHFVVATPVFDSVVADHDPLIRALEEEPADSGALPRLAQAIQDQILKAGLSPGLVDTVTGAYQAFSRHLGEEAVCVSVRSSATAEDGTQASFAGQYTTCLHVRGAAALVKAVREVWASTWSAQAVAYRKQHPGTAGRVSMAVIVQQMVEAVSAGTIYTVDPETGVPLTCINAVRGLGIAEVSGESTPTSWLIDPWTLTVIRRRAGPGTTDPIEADTLFELARQVNRIRAYFLANWEIQTLELEYACARGGQIFFTQVRPETVWSQGKACLTAVDLDRAPDLPPVFAGGTTGCPGVATGVVRVVPSLAEAEGVAQVGDILVTPNTSNVWEQLFGRIGGIITEVGGTGSHTAVVMRELGKPALVGASGAMQVLAAYDGRPITLDSTQRLVFAGSEAAGMTHRLHTVTPRYGGLDTQTEEASWAEAGSQPGRTLTDGDGQRWIFKPEYPVCRFMQAVYLQAHRWIGQRLGVPVRNDIQGQVHRIAFADVMQWRLRLRTLSLDDLEQLQRERQTVMTDYLAACSGFELDPEAVRHWLRLYVRLNAFIGLAFSIYKVTEGLLEHALSQLQIVEPYYTQIRLARGGEGELETSRAATSLRGLVAEAKGERRSREALVAACAQQSERPLKEAGCEPFYQRLRVHARSFKVTRVAEIDLPLSSAVLAAAQAVLSALGGDPQVPGDATGFLADEAVTFFPNDAYLRRVHRLTLAAEKARQDAHHLRVRGHWQIRDRLEQFASYLVGEDKLDRFDALFDHSPDWLLQQVDDFRGRARAPRSGVSTMYTGIPSDLIFDDEPLDGLLYGSGGAEPSPADALAACEGRDELPAEWRKAVVAILVRDPEKGRGLVAETLSRIVDQEAKALEGTDADQPRDLLRLARLWCAVQRNDEAEAAYRRALAVLDGPEALSPDERLLATGQLAELLDAVGRSPEAQEQRALGEAERLLANPDTGALIAVRSTALRLFLAGRYDAAAQLYRRLLERHFQKAGTWVHLARVLLMQDRIAEARQAVAHACKSARRPAGPEAVPPYVWPRTLFLRLAFAMLRRRPNAHLVWKLKSALRASPEQEPWTIAPVVDCIRSALLPTDSELLIAFAEAINDADKLDALDGLSNAVIADANPPCAARDDSPAC